VPNPVLHGRCCARRCGVGETVGVGNARHCGTDESDGYAAD
jgi:hypothetical protein